MAIWRGCYCQQKLTHFRNPPPGREVSQLTHQPRQIHQHKENRRRDSHPVLESKLARAMAGSHEPKRRDGDPKRCKDDEDDELGELGVVVVYLESFGHFCVVLITCATGVQASNTIQLPSVPIAKRSLLEVEH